MSEYITTLQRKIRQMLASLLQIKIGEGYLGFRMEFLSTFQVVWNLLISVVLRERAHMS